MTCVHLINNRAPWRSFFAVGSIASNRYGMAPYFLNPNVSSTNIVRSEVGTYHSIIKSLNTFTLKAGIEKINEIEKSAQ